MWYVFVGSGLSRVPGRFPRGAYPTEESAMDALQRWAAQIQNSKEESPEVYLSAHHVRLRGYATRAQARAADVADESGKGQGETIRVLERGSW